MRARDFSPTGLSWTTGFSWTFVWAVALLILTVAAVPAGAQGSSALAGPPRTTIAGGYSFLRDLGAGGTPASDFANGWFASVATPLHGPRWLLAGEVSSQSRKNAALERPRATAFLGGLHVPIVGLNRLAVFGRALVGAEHFSEPGFDEWNLAFQPGAGVDISLPGPIDARVGADYRLVNTSGITLKSMQITAGVVLRVGGS